MNKLLIDVGAFADAYRPDASSKGKSDLKRFIGRFEVDAGGCGECGTKYRPAMYPCNQCKDSPNMISHRTPKTTRLNKYFIGATVREAMDRCPGLWLIPWRERPGNLIKIHFQAWFKGAWAVITYEPGKIMSEDRWQDVKAIQILPELKK
jgi:hypothetical protein